MKLTFIPILILLLAACTTLPNQTDVKDKSEEQDVACYNRETMGHLFKVDSHLHFQPFGGEQIPHQTMMSYLQRMGIEHANMYGIGQTLPYRSGCSYYLDCPGVPVTPSMRNDFINANQSLFNSENKTQLTVSMTFLDLANPESILQRIQLLDQEYPGLYRWAGEVNLVKQALFANGHKPVTEDEIKRWTAFMPVLQQRSIPLGLHADLGNNDNNTEYLHLMKTVLETYQDNKIIWLHMGLSKELTNIEPDKHIAILQELLDQYPHLMIDLSWRVIYDNYFQYPEKRTKYVEFINNNYDRFLTGTDFVAAGNKTFEVYQEEVKYTSYINGFLDDRAFRHVALGLNYYRLMGINKTVAPICSI